MKREYLSVDYQKGLSTWQVQQRIKDGLVNTPPNKVNKSNWKIIKDNVCTLFNFLNVMIGVALFLVGAYSNMVYLIIIIMNVLIGIIQEIHAKNLVEKLTLITMDKAKVIRDSKQIEIAIEAIVQDDILVLAMGNQISVDATIVHNEIEVNESLLSGESDVIVKTVGDSLYSGSFVVGGKAYALVDKVGNKSSSSQLISEVKQYKRLHSELIAAIAKISRFTSFVIVPIGIVLFVQAYFIRDINMHLSIVNTAAALLGMLPKGLVLLIGISSATGVIKLSKRDVLVQDMHCMERFAHVDMLCLDKTGTITEGKMKVVEVKKFIDIDLDLIMANYVVAAVDNNATFNAMYQYFLNKEATKYRVIEKTPFSSERKWGSITFEQVGKISVGAPENMELCEAFHPEIKIAQKEGYRVLLIAQEQEAIGMILLDDPIREHAQAAFAYFKREGIDVCVISGDHPLTVANIARRAGLEGYETFVDISKITDENELRAFAYTHKVFGRVSPRQKKILVNELQKKHTVAMTGDGVNDVLALREADCSIAIAQGNSATKQVAQVVLLDNDFSRLPMVLSEGRRITNNITKVSSIFFIKTIYSFLLSILCIVANLPFPFIPMQITFIDLIIEGYPSFFLSFELNDKKVEGQYLKKAFVAAFPFAIMIIFNFIGLYLLQSKLHLSLNALVSMMYLILGYISVMAVLKACLPFNLLRFFLFISVSSGFTLGIFLFASLLDASFVNLPLLILLVVINACVLIVIHHKFILKNNI